MNFLMRSTTTHVDRDNNKPSSVSESRLDSLPPPSPPLPASRSLENLLSDDPYAQFGTRVQQFDGEIDAENDLINDFTFLAKHFDVSQEEGWIAIPFSMCYILLMFSVLCSKNRTDFEM
jgi:hypothetical protein